MTTAPTAREVLRSLDRRQQAEQIESLAALDSVHQAEARRALRAVKGAARIDLPVLIESVRRSVAERAAAEAASKPPAQPWRWAFSALMSDDQRQTFERLVAAGGDPDLAASTALATGPRYGIAGLGAARVYDNDIEPDEELDDLDDDDAPPRRQVKRRRLVRAEPRKPEREPREFYLGPRLLGPGDPDRRFGESIDFDRHHEPMTPPWLLPDEPDEENDDGTTDEARAAARD